MDIYILDKDTLDRIGTVDLYESFIWNTVYSAVGSFELHCNMEYFSLLQSDRLVQNTKDDKHIGLIENISKVTQDDGTETLAVKGRMAEALLDRRIALGEYAFESTEPAEIIGQLIQKNAIDSRTINQLAVGELVKADEGVIDYGGKNESLLKIISGICSEALLGFNLRADDENNKYIFETYKGVNRTEEANTSTEIVTKPITDMLVNGSFDNGLSSWSVVNNERAFDFRRQEYFGPFPMTVSGGVVSKSKVCSIGDDGTLFDIWQPSPHMSQSVTLNSDHIYYSTLRINNPTSSVISCGVDVSGTYSFNIGKTSGYVVQGAVIVVPTTGTYSYYMGKGELEERHDQFVYFDAAALFDLTATFGAGKEPPLNWCKKNICFDGIWKYKEEHISFVDNDVDPIVFSRDWDTFITVEYMKNITNHCTYLYIQGADDVSTFVSVGEETSLNRKERLVDLAGEVPRVIDGVTIPLPSYTAMLVNKGKSLLRSMAVNEMIDGTLYPLSNKQFGRDFYLGDIVSCVDEFMGFETSLRITGATEVWDTSGYSASVTLGDDVPDIYETIKLVSKGAK